MAGLKLECARHILRMRAILDRNEAVAVGMKQATHPGARRGIMRSQPNIWCVFQGL